MIAEQLIVLWQEPTQRASENRRLWTQGQSAGASERWQNPEPHVRFGLFSKGEFRYCSKLSGLDRSAVLYPSGNGQGRGVFP